MLSIDPPLLLNLEVSLEEEQQISRRHGATGEEVCRHPSLLVIVWSRAMGEYVHEEFASRLQGSGNLGHEQFIVLHVLKKLARNIQ